ncbi:hypothetical protein N7456_009714 [Penicillium angulare]|uniref:Uncharacterized protein n=1 Tax=Penicillium angulare TaxID=116970 RepID=A0A9W9K5G8_9EURO|nr:hypothetical protein N7456_009714 [Penicillium angulare]
MKSSLAYISALVALSYATVTLLDPSDYVDLEADTNDNVLAADYENPGATYQTITITGPYYFFDNETILARETYSVDKNDTSVIVITEESNINMTYIDVIKNGYASSLNQASFYGANAAINVANASVSYIDHSNITTRNGAANIYAYGTNTTVFVTNTDLYSSGPCAHGLYASGNGTIYASNVRQYSGGIRSSAFAGDGPAGYLYISDSIAHTAERGSAIFYALGEAYATNIVGIADNSPSLFSDGGQKSVFENVDFTAGLLAGTVLFCSQPRETGASLSFSNSRLTTTGENMPGLWFGNIIAEVQILATTINTTSGILVVANSSRITPEFDYFAGAEYSSYVLPAIVDIAVSSSELEGDLVTYNGSSITWTLGDYSTWTGTAYSKNGEGTVGVNLDATSKWVVTADTVVQNITVANLSSIVDQGYSISYNLSSSANAWLNGGTVQLFGGGKLTPS